MRTMHVPGWLKVVEARVDLGFLFLLGRPPVCEDPHRLIVAVLVLTQVTPSQYNVRKSAGIISGLQAFGICLNVCVCVQHHALRSRDGACMPSH